MSVVIDIETENIGYDIMNDNKRIISIQLYDGVSSIIFYDGALKNNLDKGKEEINSRIAKGEKFIGFNIRNFDAIFLNKFLNIDIPSEQIIDISDMKQLVSIKEKIGKKKPRLVEICNHLSIDCSHKELMNEESTKLKKIPAVLQKAKEGAEKWNKDLGWSYNFSYVLALDRITGGLAIINSFNEFIKNGGNTDSLFYKYAMGDVYVENQLYEKLNKLSEK